MCCNANDYIDYDYTGDENDDYKGSDDVGNILIACLVYEEVPCLVRVAAQSNCASRDVTDLMLCKVVRPAHPHAAVAQFAHY